MPFHHISSKTHYSYIVSVAILFITGVVLAGCSNTSEQQPSNINRPTLTDLTQKRTAAPVDAVTMSKAQRSRKLAQIYQQLLSIEPDPEIRTHVEYRLVQINTESFETLSYGGEDDDFIEPNQSIQAEDAAVLAQLKQDNVALQKLISDYQDLLQRYPNRPENEHLQYQLAKALDLQGQQQPSLVEMESLLRNYPHTQYLAELNFRRGEIYYNQQNYPAAIQAYYQVLQADNNQKYKINSLYMSGWSQFKLNRLPEADKAFLKVFEAIIDADDKQNTLTQENFSFDKLGQRAQNLAIDTQRVLSISLSQQGQSESLVQLIKSNASLPNLALYQHVLFDNLAQFLLKKELIHDAELTYKAYIDLAKDNMWSTRFSLSLLDLYQSQGKFASMHELKEQFVNQYGLNSAFWAVATPAQQTELLPNLLSFSDEHSRRTYAYAQSLQGNARVSAFSQAANALKVYLNHALLPQALSLLSKDIVTDQYLFADANFEAKQYLQALTSYQQIAYPTDALTHSLANPTNTAKVTQTAERTQIQLQSAYATTITIREMIKGYPQETQADNSQYQTLIIKRNQLDKDFISHYPQDKRALQIATNAAEYSFEAQDYAALTQFTNFVLLSHRVIDQNAQQQAVYVNVNSANSLSPSALKQVQFVSQLYANSLYQQGLYAPAERGYTLALAYADKKSNAWLEMRNLLASSIYFQAQALKLTQADLAVTQLLRVGQVVPESTYAVNAEFDAANLLLEQQRWQEAVMVLKPFKLRYPNHQFSAAIPAKLAQSFEALGQWELAAEQLLIIVDSQDSISLKREALYTAAEYYLKAGNATKALTTFKHYANTYPQPFDIAQEARFKVSEFYQASGEQTKQFYWFKQILSFHQKQAQSLPQHIQTRQIELASLSAFGLGEAEQQSFISIKLNVPLQKSLKRKQDAMKKAIGYYQQVLDFQLAKYVPHTTFNLAEMYRQLAQDMMQSQRPTDLDELALEEYDILLEELAYPFEEKAIEIHVSNTERAWQNIYDQWVGQSFNKLAEIAPALYQKPELTHEVIDAIH
ncbi:tetratricopeptide repeat protein [Shewanella sp. OMA3-2]|uniref:tetratricopeptide repeat protein n=1 Tax=Shewanella sp. OMA3-2 TaxID=2908650 RepID=UPI001F284F83|nr:tetratricopeptide repeat protein [Shewanella sp. OMA3-2]UJF21183.1 tetratricopeptide repeat protein [Shewanella sp. OMA3-2]